MRWLLYYLYMTYVPTHITHTGAAYRAWTLPLLYLPHSRLYLYIYIYKPHTLLSHILHQTRTFIRLLNFFFSLDYFLRRLYAGQGHCKNLFLAQTCCTIQFSVETHLVLPIFFFYILSYFPERALCNITRLSAISCILVHAFHGSCFPFFIPFYIRFAYIVVILHQLLIFTEKNVSEHHSIGREELT